MLAGGAQKHEGVARHRAKVERRRSAAHVVQPVSPMREMGVEACQAERQRAGRGLERAFGRINAARGDAKPAGDELSGPIANGETMGEAQIVNGGEHMQRARTRVEPAGAAAGAGGGDLLEITIQPDA